MGFKFCDTSKPHFGQIQDGRHPNNKINVYLVTVLEFDFCVYCNFFNGKVSITQSILMITGHGIHFGVILKLNYTENMYHFLQNDFHY